jgi:hypothetical protein
VCSRRRAAAAGGGGGAGAAGGSQNFGGNDFKLSVKKLNINTDRHIPSSFIKFVFSVYIA